MSRVSRYVRAGAKSIPHGRDQASKTRSLRFCGPTLSRSPAQSPTDFDEDLRRQPVADLMLHLADPQRERSFERSAVCDRERNARADAEWRRLELERSAIAERLQAILGKFQWLEGELSRS